MLEITFDLFEVHKHESADEEIRVSMNFSFASDDNIMLCFNTYLAFSTQ